jgi:adenylate cyclase
VLSRSPPGTFSPVTVRGAVRAWFLGLSLMWRIRILISTGLFSINLVGAFLVFWLIAFVLPLPATFYDQRLQENLVLLLLCIPPVTVYGHVCAMSITRPVLRWVLGRRQPTDDEKRHLLRIPRLTFVYHAAGWAVTGAVFVFYNLRSSPENAWIVAQVVFLAGVTASCIAYMVTELLLRPFTRLALASGVPDRLRVRTVAMRTMFAWALGTVTPVVGSILLGIRTLTDDDPVSRTQLSLAMIVLGVIALMVGGFTIYLAARASSDPVRELRQSLSRVGRGDLAVEVQIYDGTEIGLLQAGFNEMVAGLQERERLQDLFGRHVGSDVARSALDGGVELGGEVREVAVLFVDIIGSTSIAAQRPPEEVVALLNRFFDVVIDVVHEHDGWINKFQGDAALAVWGAPLEVTDMAGKVLQAARTLGSRLHREVPELAAGIGVSCGTAVAGNVGASERYEYTVIGDPVNEAARLTELAKDVPGHVVAQAGLLAACADEAAYWQELEPVVVRGRTEPTRVATPLRQT